ncbi:saccharopine dehydrogenase, putative [Ichthyophthirius multifiliis]|uniref:Saccharopine dehydrogenase, putative n=1 Tax=Ichthyophthirius multifiliis TaxID=5932 RepID=G0QUW4_ICHMU|nr:saccharopine dehydrogenase, putative [Ichthyophthirius multifiliis]EGR30969.1 saccharopine dehydrogenase, putative [Ichthyophthirius multifiliis]|eukprot:XP_004034442.1 saccharopine dehydrogenase, putative [Ichthyophthirius multifiliis]
MKNILLLGSGLMSETVVDYLLQRPENYIMIASNIEKDAQAIAIRKQRCNSSYVDVKNDQSLQSLIQNVDIVISYVPAVFHPLIAKVCLKLKKNLVTASYISPEMAAMDKEVRDSNLTFLNEIGLDPGIDHLATMKTIDEVHEKGGKIIEYESWCGGLPSPEHCNNPLGYKFSWSPIGALSALANDAKYLDNGEIKIIQGQDLLYNSEPKDICIALRLEGYPNRDSLNYQNIYNLKDCKKVLRGTLRYIGFSTIINSFKELGLFSKEIATQNESWLSYFERITEEKKPQNDQTIQEVKQFILDQNNDVKTQLLLQKMINIVLSNKNYLNLNIQEKLNIAKLTINAIKYFEFFNQNHQLSNEKTILENLCSLLEKKISLGPSETDLVVMQHIFKIQYKDSDKIITRKSTLIMLGEKNGKTAMALTVGTPTGVAAQLILDGVIIEKGVIIPNKKSIYEPISLLLEKENIRCVETETDQ